MAIKTASELHHHIHRWSDVYFSRTKKIIDAHGDCTVVYAVFMRRPVIAAIDYAIEWLEKSSALCEEKITITRFYEDGDWVGSGEKLFHIEGSFSFLIEFETLLLQKIGAACVAAYNAFSMSKSLPKTAFIAMDARHNAGEDMTELMAYAASVGSKAAIKDSGAIGFIGNSINHTAHYFGNETGLGTMPHNIIGYAGSTVRAAEMMAALFPHQKLTVLVDYFGHEITDALAVCNALKTEVEAGQLSIRIDTHGGRFCEGLDQSSSYEILNRHAPHSIKRYCTEKELHYLVGSGVSAAALWHLREELDKAGFKKVTITASSGFSPAKCEAMALSKAPIDTIGTGSFLPELWTETYATADIISYDGKICVKAGREFLLKEKKTAQKPIK
jgi:nicotinate phosphoribosyltransferase